MMSTSSSDISWLGILATAFDDQAVDVSIQQLAGVIEYLHARGWEIARIPQPAAVEVPPEPLNTPAMPAPWSSLAPGMDFYGVDKPGSADPIRAFQVLPDDNLQPLVSAGAIFVEAASAEDAKRVAALVGTLREPLKNRFMWQRQDCVYYSDDMPF